ncbi:MAG: hypothetical protein HQM08_13830 [Candidatus Riflebacteria bacterium]|nr:hypothetical protein [Candidatus Riflebacteria bacterium]
MEKENSYPTNLGSSGTALFYPRAIFCGVWVVIIYNLCKSYNVQLAEHAIQDASVKSQ